MSDDYTLETGESRRIHALDESIRSSQLTDSTNDILLRAALFEKYLKDGAEVADAS